MENIGSLRNMQQACLNLIKHTHTVQYITTINTRIHSNTFYTHKPSPPPRHTQALPSPPHTLPPMLKLPRKGKVHLVMLALFSSVTAEYTKSFLDHPKVTGRAKELEKG